LAFPKKIAKQFFGDFFPVGGGLHINVMSADDLVAR
jgi:hypothetical protein